MADVQLENGYTKIANEILEQMAKIKLSPTQYRLIFVIWRFTYGFKRKEHEMSLSFLSDATGIDKRNVQRELKSLQERKIIFQEIKSGSYRKISFNKNYDEWVGKITIGKTTIGEITNGETNNTGIGETDNGAIGEIDNTTIGETDNQEIKDKENIKEKSKEKDDQMDKPNPITEYEKFFGFPPPILIQDFNYWIDKSQFQEPEAIICEVIKRAKLHNPKFPAKYINSALKTLHDLELYTLSSVREYNAKFDAKFKKQPNVITFKDMSRRPKGVSEPPPLTDEELQELKEIEEKLPF